MEQNKQYILKVNGITIVIDAKTAKEARNKAEKIYMELENKRKNEQNNIC